MAKKLIDYTEFEVRVTKSFLDMQEKIGNDSFLFVIPTDKKNQVYKVNCSFKRVTKVKGI